MRAAHARTQSATLARQERLRFVESMVLWEGLVRRQRVTDVFGVNLNHVTRDLRYYQEQYPGALDFRPEQRGYIAGPKFKPRYASDSPAEYLGLLQARADAASVTALPQVGGQDLALAALPSPAMGIDKEVLREVVRAQRRGHGIAVTYLAMNSDKPSRRVLWPHALISTGLRWYVRAFDGESQSFRSLVMARIERAKPSDAACPVEAKTDVGWHHQVTAEVIPNPGLNAHQKSVIAREFGMERFDGGWRWSVELRQCLVGHFARRYRLDDADISPEASWLALNNRVELQRFFLPGGKE